MSQFVATNALERSIRALGGGALSLDKLRSDAGFDQLQELETQFQVPIFGIASSGAAWQTVSLRFDVQFMYSPEQRDSPLSVPHFSYGPVVSGVPSPDETVPDPNNPDSLVAVTCQVVAWGRDQQNDAVIGAVLGFGASTLGGKDVKFAGYVHLTFQGFGNVVEEDPNIMPS